MKTKLVIAVAIGIRKESISSSSEQLASMSEQISASCSTLQIRSFSSTSELFFLAKSYVLSSRKRMKIYLSIGKHMFKYFTGTKIHLGCR